MSEVVSIHGHSVPGEPEPGVVEALEYLLERAKRGDLTAVAYATVALSGAQATGWAGGSGTRHPLASTIMMLNHRYAAGLLEGPRE